MLDPGSNNELPPIPAKRYFTIGEVSDLCLVKPHVLRYWEQEFPNLKPVKRRGNRRYYQRHDVLMIRQIRGLLYDEGFTIGGARQRLEGDALKAEAAKSEPVKTVSSEARIDLIRGLRLELEGVLNLLSS
jgi:DNA-binding transcriptional MerR regulator